MKHKIEWLASIPPTDGAMKAHGDVGFRVTLDLPDSEAPAYIRMLLARGHVLKMTAEWDDVDVEPPRKRKAKRKEPEWGDGAENDDLG